MPIVPGTRFGPYEILSLIGAGGMGEVYRARDSRLGREVAIKVLPATFSADAERLRRFEQEAKAAGLLNHPNITAVHDIGTEDGAPYVVQELLEGETLREVLSGGRLSPRKATDYAIQIAKGLAAAHEKGIVHRDLKPENIFVTRDGRVKILDFGLAKLTSTDGDGSQTNLPTKTAGTEAGVVLGTLGYMSPEQVRGKPADARSDIFAFGAILYEMLSGKRAFHGDSAADTMSSILREDPPELSLTNQNVPAGLDRIVRHCLEKNPEQRFHSAHDLGFDLESLSDVSTPGRPLAMPAERGKKRWVLPAAVLAGLAAVAGAYVLGQRRGAGAEVAAPTFSQLTFRQQPIFNARFSPDGKTVVYSTAPWGSTPELFTVRPDFPGAVRLALKNAHLLSISSKGELAVLIRPRFNNHSLFWGTLARMPLEGAAPREIRNDVREADWTPDGTDLALIRDTGGKDTLEFPAGKVLATTGGYMSDLRFSPRGDRITFFEHPIRYDNRGGVAVVDLAGNKKVLSDGYWGLEGLAWSPSGDEVLFSGGTAYNNFKVYAVDLSGKRRVALQGAGGLTVQDVRAEKWIVTRDDRLRTMPALRPGWAAEKDLSWLDLSRVTALSPDGGTLLFTEDSGSVGANYATCLRSTEGSDIVRLGEGSALDLSPDGQWALASIPTTPQVLVLYPTGVGEPRRLEGGTVVSHENGQFFPDGRRILISGAEKGRAGRCWVQDLAGGKPRPVTPEGTLECLVSPDARSIVTRQSGGDLLIFPVDGGEPRVVPGGTRNDNVVRWSADSRSVLVALAAEVPSRIERLDVTTGKRELIRAVGPQDLTGVTGIYPIVVAADEKTHAYSCRRMISQLFLVEGAR